MDGDVARNLKKYFWQKQDFVEIDEFSLLKLKKLEKSQNWYIHNSGHISGNLWAIEKYYTSF